ncbi:MAG: hypothetical protein DRG78_23520 [Epsilonproteobacteria bacterium]|nr:MAG: hypothetical protein DRG78_23520 [Campylobacterota bacterium]
MTAISFIVYKFVSSLKISSAEATDSSLQPLPEACIPEMNFEGDYEMHYSSNGAGASPPANYNFVGNVFPATCTDISSSFWACNWYQCEGPENPYYVFNYVYGSALASYESLYYNLIDSTSIKSGVSQDFALTDEVMKTMTWGFPINRSSNKSMNITNIEFYNNGQWESRFDNSYWSAVSGTSWLNNKWTSSSSGTGATIETTGSWADTYFPSKVKITYELII